MKPDPLAGQEDSSSRVHRDTLSRFARNGLRDRTAPEGRGILHVPEMAQI